ncbi:hypothetical protein LSTR_LSTR012142 [Laodelphax striatellus]|uniref:Uncharacterized protein n=1 Tax=Laodelphax striatellus TaxID=195883 RepID=A0A482XLQ2_LAOST|nr:hypothetical protein LSTR_LSTR012142 [Laodelphax striatellus]
MSQELFNDSLTRSQTRNLPLFSLSVFFKRRELSRAVALLFYLGEVNKLEMSGGDGAAEIRIVARFALSGHQINVATSTL